jgi:hypothetical protein
VQNLVIVIVEAVEWRLQRPKVPECNSLCGAQRGFQSSKKQGERKKNQDTLSEDPVSKRVSLLGLNATAKISFSCASTC